MPLYCTDTYEEGLILVYYYGITLIGSLNITTAGKMSILILHPNALKP
jgi:hypothetical protein